jgi:hypothetical protein
MIDRLESFFSGALYLLRNLLNLREIGNGDIGYFAHDE